MQLFRTGLCCATPHNGTSEGYLARIVATYATQPFDTLKTRCQSTNGASTVKASKNIMADGGVLWSGSVVRLGRTVRSGGILFTVYEQAVAVLNPNLIPE